MPPSAVADAGLRDTDLGAGMGEAVRRVCAMGFPESEARFALEAHSTYEEAIAFLLDDGDAVGVALAANPAEATSDGRNWRRNPVHQRGGWRARRKMVQHALRQAKAAGDADAIAAAGRRLKAADCRPAKQQTTGRAAAESPSGPEEKEEDEER